MSEANKDESLNCINLANKCIKEGDYSRADKYLIKSQKLFPSKEADDLRKRLTKGKEEEEIIGRVLRETDYYRILGVHRGATAEEIKTAYRKLALQLHPDKNRSPNASEAFKSINRAFSVLTEGTSRSTYDRGESNTQFEQNISPEDIFRAFFANEFGMAGRYHVRRERVYVRQEGHGNLLVGVIPLILFVVIPLLTSIFTPAPQFSITRSGVYSVAHVTSKHDLEYYVRSDYKGDAAQLERGVIQSYIAHLTDLCREEVQLRKRVEFMAYFGDRDAQNELNHFRMTHCTRLEALKRG